MSLPVTHARTRAGMPTTVSAAMAAALLLLPAAAACDSTPYPQGENFTTTVQSPPDGARPAVVDVDIADGSVQPTNATVRADVGERIELHVDSDAAAEIRVDAGTDRVFAVAPRDDQVFGFTIEAPGTATVALTDPAQTLATIEVVESTR